MKAVVIHEPGEPEQLIYTEVPTPAPRPGWSLVKVMGRGINHSEIFTRKGESPSVEFPRILGIECVGIIEESTDPVRLPEGQQVVSIMGEMGRAFDGSYAECVLIPNEQIYPISSSLPWEVLAAIPETYYTAYGSMQNLRLESGEKVLVRAATSGVGIAFAKLVKATFPWMHLAGSCRSLSKASMLEAAGFDEVIEDRDGMLQTRKSFDKALELIGPAALRDTCSHISEGGIVCSTGQLGGKWDMEGFEPIMDLPANGYLTSFYSGNVDEKRLGEMLSYVANYKVDARPEKVFPLSETASAHAYLEGSQSFGKVVVI